VADAVLVQDTTLLALPGVLDGLRAGGRVLVNSPRTPAELGLAVTGPGRLLTVPASEIALRHLGRPLPNAALLGGLAAVCPLVSLDGVVAAIGARFAGPVAEKNQAAAREAYAAVVEEMADVAAG
jgi:pyruvate ferredoxin oxidoreductase gamma subunit